MYIVLVSKDIHYKELLHQPLKHQNIGLKHLYTLDASHLFTEPECLAVILDIYNPQIEDFLMWRQLNNEMSKPVILTGSDKTNVNHVLNRQTAVLTLIEPFTKFAISRKSNMPITKFKLTNDLYFDIAGHCLWKNSKCIYLTSQEFKFLYQLVCSENQFVDIQELLHMLELNNKSSLYVLVNKIREKIEPFTDRPTILTSQRGRGYTINILRDFKVEA